MDDEGHRAAVDAAYARLREMLEAKDVSVHGLKEAALEALNTARVLVEIEPDGKPKEGRDDAHDATQDHDHNETSNGTHR